MAKAPAIQFYVKDWLSDPQLKMASFATKGIWIDMICYMWAAPEQGKLIGSKSEIGKLLGATAVEIDVFFEEAGQWGFCDITPCSGNVTGMFAIINRRMYRNQKDKEASRLRMQRMRGVGDPLRDCSDVCYGDVQRPTTDGGVVGVGDIYIKEKNKYFDCVFLSEEELKKLVAKNGQFLTDKAISILNNYIMGKGKDPYKSHYHTLIGWPMERVREKYGRGARNSGGGPGVQTTPPEWKPETPISEEQRLANIERIKKLTGGKG